MIVAALQLNVNIDLSITTVVILYLMVNVV